MSIRDRKIAAARAQGFAQILSAIGPDRKRASGVVTIPQLLLSTAKTDEERAYLMARHEADLAAHYLKQNSDAQHDHNATDSLRGWPEN